MRRTGPIFCALLAAGMAAAGPTEEAQTQVLTKLQDEETWTNPKNKKVLLDSLESANKLGSAQLAPILLKHVDYSPLKPSEITDMTTKGMQYPAYRALKAIGISAVQPILDEMKLIRLDDKPKGNARLRLALLATCLFEIYAEGGSGRDLAIKRMELEAQTTLEKDRKALLEAIKTPF